MKKNKEEITLKNKINLKNVSFRFGNKKQYILKNINLEIKRNELIGIAEKVEVVRLL